MSKTTQSPVKVEKMNVKQKSTKENNTSKKIDNRVDKKITKIAKDIKKRTAEELEVDRIIESYYPDIADDNEYSHETFKTVLPKNYLIPYNSNVMVEQGTYAGQYGRIVERKITITVNKDKLIRKVEVLYKIFIDEITGIIRVLSDEIQSD